MRSRYGVSFRCTGYIISRQVCGLEKGGVLWCVVLKLCFWLRAGLGFNWCGYVFLQLSSCVARSHIILTHPLLSFLSVLLFMRVISCPTKKKHSLLGFYDIIFL